MKVSRSTIFATFTAFLIGGAALSPAAAAVAGNAQSDKGKSPQSVYRFAVSACESDAGNESDDKILRQLLSMGW